MEEPKLETRNSKLERETPTTGAACAGAERETPTAAAPPPFSAGNPQPGVYEGAEPALMARIRVKQGPAIAAACHSSSVPPEFLAALIANESGGRSAATRFEPAVYSHLITLRDDADALTRGSVLPHRPPHFGSITPADLSGRPEGLLRAYATSWGLTQIMGYHAIGSAHAVAELAIDAVNLRCAIALLAAFCKQFNLDPRLDFEPMFRCWNSGRPDGQTRDPRYVTNGLRRMGIWKGLEGRS